MIDSHILDERILTTEVKPQYLEPWAVFAAIEQLEERILDSPRVPLTGKTMVDEEELLDRLDAIRLSLPEVITTAQEIVLYQERLIKEAQQQVQQILAEANQRAYQVANELGIIDRAEQEARQIRQIAIAECEQLRQQTIIEVQRTRDCHLQEIERMRAQVMIECQQIQAGADDYADRVLQNMEHQLTDILQAIQSGRQRLSNEGSI
jgi:vacuolar-type H+-ATPase subunit H